MESMESMLLVMAAIAVMALVIYFVIVYFGENLGLFI